MSFQNHQQSKAPRPSGVQPQPAMWAAVVENATAAGHGRREDERAWVRSRETPPSPAMALTHAKITSWLDRGGDVDVTTMECAPPSLPPLLSALSESTFGDCQPLTACAASSLPAPALTRVRSSLSPVRSPRRGHTFLISAVTSNNEWLVDELLTRGASVDYKAAGKTALHYACVLGHASCARRVSSDTHANRSGREHAQCPAHSACPLSPRTALLVRSSQLLQYGASPTLRVDVDESEYTECDGMTALEIVEAKIPYARDPYRERLVELQAMIERAAARPPTPPRR